MQGTQVRTVRLIYHIQGSYHTCLRHAHPIGLHRIVQIIDDIHSKAGIRISGDF